MIYPRKRVPTGEPEELRAARPSSRNRSAQPAGPLQRVGRVLLMPVAATANPGPPLFYGLPLQMFF